MDEQVHSDERGVPLRMVPRAQSFGIPDPQEYAAARRLARGMALALSDSSVRQSVKRALASSAVHEQKLHFASFVEGRGGELLRAMSARGGLSSGDVAVAASTVRDLEFYMPVQQHRALWSGGNDVLVGIALDEDVAPIAFNLRGEQVLMDRETAPATPVLMLVPVETDFTDQVRRNLEGRPERACVAEESEGLASAASRCRGRAIDGGVSGNASLSSLTAPSLLLNANGDSSAVRMTFLRIYEGCGGECWAWGDPEYDIMALGKKATSDTAASVLQCAGQDPYAASQPGIRDGAFGFDQNNRFWSGRVALLSADQIDSLRVNADSTFTLELYEDDYERCRIAVDNEHYRAAWNSLRWSIVYAALGAGVIAVSDSSEWDNYRAIVLYGNVVSSIAYLIDAATHLIIGDDDFLGVFVLKSETQWAGQFPENNFVVVKGSEMLARATLTGYPGEPEHGTLDRIELSADSLVMPSQHVRDVDAFGFDAYSVAVPIGEPTWSSSNSAIASVDGSGVVTGVAVGDVTLTANYNGILRSIPVKVRNVGEVASVVIAGSTFTVEVNKFLQLNATGYDAFGTVVPVSPSGWNSSDAYVASVFSDGRVIGEEPGSAVISVSMDGVSASKTIRVIAEQCVPPPGEKKCD